MKALTIHQPYAHLILLPESDPCHKRVENRTWHTRYRGSLLIHAGKSRESIGDSTEFAGVPLAFGAIVGVAELVDCLPIAPVRAGEYDKRYPWLREHKHAQGPFCWVLHYVRPLTPVPMKGAQGLFDVNDDSVKKQLVLMAAMK